MDVYNAFCDRVPVIVLGGNDLDAAHRPPGVPTVHSAQDINAHRARLHQMGRHAGLGAALRAVVRARLQIATTPPCAPVMISLDDGLQQEPIDDYGQALYIPKFVPTAPPAGEVGAVREAARLLVNAERPVIVADRAVDTQRRHRSPGAARRAAAGAGGPPARPPEFPDHPSISAGRRA